MVWCNYLKKVYGRNPEKFLRRKIYKREHYYLIMSVKIILKNARNVFYNNNSNNNSNNNWDC